MLWSALLIAFKKAWATVPYLVLANAVTIPSLFLPIAGFLGPHVLAGIGAVIGSAVRFRLLKLTWREWPIEAAFACVLGLVFGEAELPVVSKMLSRISPEMFPVAQGVAIGILMAAGTGFLADFIKAYQAKAGGKTQ